MIPKALAAWSCDGARRIYTQPIALAQPHRTESAILNPEQYAVYRTVIKQVLSDSERLPSLPSITLDIRKAINEPSTSAHSLAQMIARDPALSALLVKSASSPLYRRMNAPKTLADVIAVLGYANVGSLVMVHSVRSLFVLRSPSMKQLFSRTWNRVVLKTSLASFLAKRLNHRLLDEAQMAALLSEVGALAVLSAMSETNQEPDADTYFLLCRRYAKSLGAVLLQKWSVDREIIAVLRRSGDWAYTVGEEISLIDVMNLAIYYTAQVSREGTGLPALPSLVVYGKLSEEHKRCVQTNRLALIAENKAEIVEIMRAFK